MSPAVSEELSSYNYYGRAVKTARPYSSPQRFRKLGASRVQHLCRRIISIKGSLQLMYQFLLARLPDQPRFLMPSVCNISIQGVNGTGCLLEVKDRKVAGIHSQRAVITDPVSHRSDHDLHIPIRTDCYCQLSRALCNCWRALFSIREM